MYSGSSCARVVATGISGLFVGLTMLISAFLGDNEPFFSLDYRRFILLTLCATIFVWILGWYILHICWKRSNIRRNDAYKAATILLLIGVIATIFSIQNLAQG